MNILLVKKYYHLTNNKFTYSPLGKAFDKQIKTIEGQGEKQVKALEGLELKSKSTEGIFPKGYESFEIKSEVDKIKEREKKSIETI